MRTLAAAVRDADAVLSALGPRNPRADAGITSRGTRAIVAAMQAEHVLGGSSSSALHPSAVPVPGRSTPPRHDPGDGFFMLPPGSPVDPGHVRPALRRPRRHRADPARQWTAMDGDAPAQTHRQAPDRHVPDRVERHPGAGSPCHAPTSPTTSSAMVNQPDTIEQVVGIAQLTHNQPLQHDPGLRQRKQATTGDGHQQSREDASAVPPALPPPGSPITKDRDHDAVRPFRQPRMRGNVRRIPHVSPRPGTLAARLRQHRLHPGPAGRTRLPRTRRRGTSACADRNRGRLTRRSSKHPMADRGRTRPPGLVLGLTLTVNLPTYSDQLHSNAQSPPSNCTNVRDRWTSPTPSGR
ncbi:hypothetical protein SALBM311S_09694 [Streptomyces alboniger]